MTEIDYKYAHLSLVLPEEEITPELKKVYNWEYEVLYYDEGAEVGFDDLSDPHTTGLLSASYFSPGTDKFEEVEKRWSYDNRFIQGGIISVILKTKPKHFA